MDKASRAAMAAISFTALLLIVVHFFPAGAE
jgi:hypothetical protein